MISEEDYILVSDLRTVRMVLTDLREVMSAPHNPCIDPEEYKQVMSALQKWQESMFAEVYKREP